MTFFNAATKFWNDENGDVTVTSMAGLTAAAAAVLALAGGLQHPDRGLALVPLAGGVKEKREKRWEWNCEGKLVLAERNVARDVKLGRTPGEGTQRPAFTHTGENVTAVTWQWPGDGRVFLVPTEVLGVLPQVSLTKDVIIAAGHLYREQHYPADRKIETSYRQLAETLALAWAGGRIAKDLEEALTLARWLTIQNYPVIRKLSPSGHVKELSQDTFGFIDHVSRIVIREGKKIAYNRQPVEITLSQLYTLMLKKLPASPVPLAALEAAHRAPIRLRTPAKTLVYYLASRVPLTHISLAQDTLSNILGYQNNRKLEFQRAVENVAGILNGVIISNYTYSPETNVYTFTLAGKPCQEQDGKSCQE